MLTSPFCRTNNTENITSQFFLSFVIIFISRFKANIGSISEKIKCSDSAWSIFITEVKSERPKFFFDLSRHKINRNPCIFISIFYRLAAVVKQVVSASGTLAPPSTINITPIIGMILFHKTKIFLQ